MFKLIFCLFVVVGSSSQGGKWQHLDGLPREAERSLAHPKR